MTLASSFRRALVNEQLSSSNGCLGEKYKSSFKGRDVQVQPLFLENVQADSLVSLKFEKFVILIKVFEADSVGSVSEWPLQTLGRTPDLVNNVKLVASR